MRSNTSDNTKAFSRALDRLLDKYVFDREMCTGDTAPDPDLVAFRAAKARFVKRWAPKPERETELLARIEARLAKLPNKR